MEDNRMIDMGLVLEGGGLRGIYTAGVLDVLLRCNIQFSYCIGVSAGAAYGISYASQQEGRNIEVNRKFISDPRYLSIWNLIRTGNVFDWNFVYREIPLTLVPFDFDTFYQHGMRFRIGITNCKTGNIEYKDGHKLEKEKLMETLAASSSIPFVSRIVTLEQTPYLDGGIADPIPVGQGFSDGNKRLVVILTQHRGYRKKPSRYPWLTRLIYKRYPLLVQALLNRHLRYNNTLEFIETMEQQGNLFVIRPQKPITVSRMEKNAGKLDVLYNIACSETMDLLPELKNWLSHMPSTK